VARLTSDDRPASGGIEGPQDNIARTSAVLADDQPVADAGQTTSDRGQAAPDHDQTASERDEGAVFDGCRERLRGLLGDHADLTIAEHAIAGYPLDDEEKAALWLWATAPFDPATVSLCQLRDGI
jgi:hypothetical protein